MARRRNKDLTSASYLDKLGETSARAYSPIVLRQVAESGVSLPLSDDDVEILLHNTIVGLDEQGKLSWQTLSSERQSVFINSWVAEMNRLGIRR